MGKEAKACKSRRSDPAFITNVQDRTIDNSLLAANTPSVRIDCNIRKCDRAYSLIVTAKSRTFLRRQFSHFAIYPGINSDNIIEYLAASRLQLSIIRVPPIFG